jgi:hypothetical protein
LLRFLIEDSKLTDPNTKVKNWLMTKILVFKWQMLKPINSGWWQKINGLQFQCLSDFDKHGAAQCE